MLPRPPPASLSLDPVVALVSEAPPLAPPLSSLVDLLSPVASAESNLASKSECGVNTHTYIIQCTNHQYLTMYMYMYNAYVNFLNIGGGGGELVIRGISGHPPPQIETLLACAMG